MKIASNTFNINGYWDKPLDYNYTPKIKDLELFDQNGYDLCLLEQKYSTVNYCKIKKHRTHRTAIKSNWIEQGPTVTGPHLNHSLLFERKAYTDSALTQLQVWAIKLPLLHKIIAMRPKWGLDFSMDYVDYEGNSFEVLHWEWDSFIYDEVAEIKQRLEPILLAIDWADAATQLLKQKEKWHTLDFFAQSDYKCNYFGIPKEQFKMVLWK